MNEIEIFFSTKTAHCSHDSFPLSFRVYIMTYSGEMMCAWTEGGSDGEMGGGMMG